MLAKKFKHMICILLCVISLIPFSSLAAVDVDGAFAKDEDALTELYGETFHWDKDKFWVDEWTDTINDKEITFKRQCFYQDEFIEDNIAQTMKYLGLNYSLSGSGSNMSITTILNAELTSEDSMETPLGSDNVKYNEWYYGKEVSNPDEDGDGVYDSIEYPWSCTFVVWCAEKAGLISSGLFKKTNDTNTLYSYLTTASKCQAYDASNVSPLGGTDYTPVAGDLFFFADPDDPERFGTVGYIVEVNDSGIYVEEGDTSKGGVHGYVAKNFYSASSGSVVTNGKVVHIEYPVAEASGSTNEEKLYNTLIAAGLNTAAACGILGMAKNETGGTFECDTVETWVFGVRHHVGYHDAEAADLWAKGAGYGLFQWTNFPYARAKGNDTKYLQNGFYKSQNGHRRTNLVNFCNANGYDFTTLTGQVYFLLQELKDSYSKVDKVLHSVPNTADGAYTAGYNFGRYFGGGGTNISASDYGIRVGNYAKAYFIQHGH